MESRAGAFTRSGADRLQDDAGRTLLGLSGPLRFPDGARLDPSGAVVVAGRAIDRIALPEGSCVRGGFLESAGVDASLVKEIEQYRNLWFKQMTLDLRDYFRRRFKVAAPVNVDKTGHVEVAE